MLGGDVGGGRGKGVLLFPRLIVLNVNGGVGRHRGKVLINIFSFFHRVFI